MGQGREQRSFTFDSSRRILRTASQFSFVSFAQLLSKIRLEVSPSLYKETLSDLRAVAPIQWLRQKNRRAKSLDHLFSPTTNTTILSLGRELEWAKAWLKGCAAEINQFRTIGAEIQLLIAKNELLIARKRIEDFVRLSGWSFWGLELSMYLIHATGGRSELERWSARVGTPQNRMLRLNLRILLDRLDEELSLDDFQQRCRESFPLFAQSAPWLPDQLTYQHLGELSASETVIANALGSHAMGTTLDYYEVVVESLVEITTSPDLRAFRKSAAELVAVLVLAKFEDHRLTKIGNALDVRIRGKIRPVASEIQTLCEYLAGSTESAQSIHSGPVADLAAALTKARSYGMSMPQPDLASALKLGLCLRGVDLGVSFSMAIQDAVRPFRATSVAHLAQAFLNPTVSPSDLLTVEAESNLAAFLASVSPQNSINSELITWAAAVSSGTPLRSIPSNCFPHLYFWLAHCLLKQSRYAECHRLLDTVRNFSTFWRRQSWKMRFTCFVRQGRIDDAIIESSQWLLKYSGSATELGTSELFDGTSWDRLRNIYSPKVALVAHSSYGSRPESISAFFCKMACRAYFRSDEWLDVKRNNLELDPITSQTLIAFFRDVCVEQNCAFMTDVVTVEQFNRFRIEILRVLLFLDPKFASEYAQEILEINLEIQVAKGLAQFSHSRVYVNESALQSWAETEISKDFNRWLNSRSDRETKIHEELILKYLIDANLNLLLNAIAPQGFSESNIALVRVVSRLYNRFLHDPHGGLDTYLSLRVRHGSLRGTLLGPLEEIRLLSESTSSDAADAFLQKWGDDFEFPEHAKLALAEVQKSSDRIISMIDMFVRDNIQIRTEAKPEGLIRGALTPDVSGMLATLLSAEFDWSLSSFVTTSTGIFWRVIDPDLRSLADHCRGSLKTSILSEISALEAILTAKNFGCSRLFHAIKSCSTVVSSKCDLVSNWFNSPGKDDDQRYELETAAQIARTATAEVYPRFDTEKIECLIENVGVRISTVNLSLLVDCIYILLENTWKHSGLNEHVGTIQLRLSYIPESHRICVVVSNPVSKHVALEANSVIEKVMAGISRDSSFELANREGGSGFAKLARMAKSYDGTARSVSPILSVDTGHWTSTVEVQLFRT
jgi:hypothetical protein